MTFTGSFVVLFFSCFFQPLTLYWAIKLAAQGNLIPEISNELRIHYLGTLFSSALAKGLYRRDSPPSLTVKVVK